MNLKTHQKLLFGLFLICLSIWIGGSLTRSVIAFDLFMPTQEFALKPGLSNEDRIVTLYLYTITAAYADFAYLISFLCFLVFSFTAREQFKKHGWLFMCVFIFFFFSPVNLLNIYYDYMLSLAVYFDRITDFRDYRVNTWFIERFRSIPLNTAAMLSFFSSLTIVLYSVTRPLDKSVITYTETIIDETEVPFEKDIAT
jgi:hypothetical protein